MSFARVLLDWFLVAYVDAYEWVELPNVIGVSQHADGGRLATKPYAGGGACINRMSDRFGACRYDVKQKTGPAAEAHGLGVHVHGHVPATMKPS